MSLPLPVVAERTAAHHRANSQSDNGGRVGFASDNVQLQLCRHTAHDSSTGGATGQNMGIERADNMRYVLSVLSKM